MEWIEKYFEEIPARPTPLRAEAPPVVLAETRSLFHEDNFANLPFLTLAWPTVELYQPDSYALVVLGTLLSDGRSTPFYKVLRGDSLRRRAPATASPSRAPR